jgi:hypothetical protein
MYGNDHSHSELAHYSHDHRGDYAPSSHSHDRYEIHNAADEHHTHSDLAYASHDHDTSHDHDGDYATAAEVGKLRDQVAELAHLLAIHDHNDRYIDLAMLTLITGRFQVVEGATGVRGTWAEPGPEPGLKTAMDEARNRDDRGAGERGSTEPEEDPEPADYDPGPEVDDEGGMSEHRHWVAPGE